MEPISAALMTFGLAILLVSWIVLVISSFKEDFTWGLCAVLMPPVAYFYGLFNWAKAKDSILLAAVGLILVMLS